MSSVPIPTVGKTNSEPNIKGPVDTSGWKKCESKGVLGCWAEYPGANLREGTCGINKKCPPAVKTSGKTLSPFGINEGKGES